MEEELKQTAYIHAGMNPLEGMKFKQAEDGYLYPDYEFKVVGEVDPNMTLHMDEGVFVPRPAPVEQFIAPTLEEKPIAPVLWLVVFLPAAILAALWIAQWFGV